MAPAEASLCAARQAKLSDSDDGSDDDSEHRDEQDVDEDIGGNGNITTEQEDGGDDTDVELVEEAYRTTKAMGDADRQVYSHIHFNTW
jgi:hypothetical protein